ncbi:MAG: hypothetical protein E4G94_01885 [ANME-2 cluster archaeon]|nr:MAG: hypothetical protein E4G94_01885 [ANME-2 cluster archaeon]
MKYLLVILVIFLLLPHSSARPIYREGIPQDMMNFCKICHVQSSGLGPLNEYGNDFYKNGKSNDAVTMLDSDGDGYQNLDELNNGTFPGDPDSYPGAETPGFGIFPAVLSFLVIFTLSKHVGGA